MRAGAVTVTLGGAPYEMRPTYGAMRDIEARTGLTVQELLELVIAGRLRIEEAVLVIWYGCQAARSFDDIDALGAVIFDERITSAGIRTALSKFLLHCLYVPKDAQGKWEAEVGPMITSDATV